ncbi:hypothetical protein ACJZ2D_009794 [Fusarium nematophilum]
MPAHMAFNAARKALEVELQPCSSASTSSIVRNTIDRVSLIDNLQFSQNPETIDPASRFEVEFDLPNEHQKFHLSLHPSRNVISTLTEVRQLGSDGSGQSGNLMREKAALIFKGSAFLLNSEAKTWDRIGWARIIVRPRDGQHLLEGAFSLDGQYHHICLDSRLRKTQPLTNEVLPERGFPYMVVWRELDTSQNEGNGSIFQRSSTNESLCAAERVHEFDSRRSFPLESSIEARDMGSNIRRQNPWDTFNPRDTIGSTSGCPSTRLVASLGVATDCSYTAEFDSLEDARANIISQINIASQVYEDAFNISLAIRNLTISDPSCPSEASSTTPWNTPCTADVDISRRLSLFSEWRGGFQDSNTAWTLLSACSAGPTVGIAWIGNICGSGTRWRGGARSVASTNVVIRTSAEWQVIAHELAHNFGASHDCTADTCSGNSPSQDCCPLSESSCDAQGEYLMNPRSGQQLRTFSPCTIGAICTAMGRELIDTSCLVDEADAPDINSSECGNGIVEPGEDCDCGGEQGCAEDSCCNPSTCQLRSGAECDPATDGCCTDQCRVAESGRVCRASTGRCDPEETCDGTSSQCPEDMQESDSCRDDGGNPGDNGGGGGGRGGGGDSGDNGGGGGGQGGSAGDWLDRNRTVVIAVSASVGGLLLIPIALCIITSCARRRRERRRVQGNRPFGVPPHNPQNLGTPQLPTAPRLVYRYG